MEQMTFTALALGESQTDRLIAHLLANRGNWVPLPELVGVCGGYAIHSRASDARKRGYDVEQSSNVEPGTRKVHSFYRLL